MTRDELLRLLQQRDTLIYQLAQVNLKTASRKQLERQLVEIENRIAEADAPNNM